MMSLSCLPWFIRKEVIDLVIEEYPEYCSISREWMRQVAIRHGRLYISDRDRNYWSSTPFTPYIEHVSFNRSTNIDWETIFLHKNLKHIDIFCFYEDVEDYTKFKSKLEGLPPLSSFALLLPENRDMDLSKVLERAKEHIRELKLGMNSLEWYPRNLMFSKLNFLHLIGTKCQFSVQEITRNTPNLNRLWLHCDISFNFDVMPNILELDITCQYPKLNTKLELSLLPRLKQLTLNELLLTSRLSHTNQIESLTIEGTADHIMQTTNIPFPNLKILGLSDNKSDKFQGVVDLIQHLTTLTTLTEFKLCIYKEVDLPIDLPKGPYSLTHLTLRGAFPITPSSLTWLSQSFNLIHLNLEFCTLDDDVNLPIVPFKSLNSLHIISRCFYTCNFEAHFNRIHYPHVETIKLREINYSD